MGKKQPTATKKPVHLYPKPEPLTISFRDPVKVTADKIADHKKRRLASFDFDGRVAEYTALLREIVLPHYGERPLKELWGARGFTVEQWANIDLREDRMLELPASAPEEARHAFEALRKLKEIKLWLRDVDKKPDSVRPDTVRLLLCWAIDAGLSIQSCDAQIKYAPSVAVGKAAAAGKAAGSQTTSRRAAQRNAMAKTEYDRRMSLEQNPTRKKNKTLLNMSQMTNSDGTPKYGSFDALKNYAKTWK